MAMSFERLVRPLAGLITLLLVAGGGALAVNDGRKDEGTYEVTAYFTKAIGLFPNSDVDVLGVPVGTIKSVTPAGTRVKVVMEIVDEHRIPADATAAIVPISLISDRYIQLEPPYESGPALADGAIIGVERTQIPAELDDVFAQLKKLLDAIEPGSENEPGALGELVVQLDKTLAGTEDDLRGTLMNASELTSTLAEANSDVSDLLVNLDDVFTTLATRAGSLGTLNNNFAAVMTLLAESRLDLESTLANLATTTRELARLARKHQGRLAQDVEIAARITGSVLENRASVDQALTWLPVVALGLKNAHHPEPVLATNVRDNANAKIECEVLDAFPDSPAKDALEEECRGFTGEPPPEPPEEVTCKRALRNVDRQVRRLKKVRLPEEVASEVLEPLAKKLRKLDRKCARLERTFDKSRRIQNVLDEVGDLPPIQPDRQPVGRLRGAAAGGLPAPPPSGSPWAGFGSWLGGWFGFMGWPW